MRPPPQTSVSWRQLCAIARQLVQAATTIDDGEWKARIKDRLAQMEFVSPPNSEQIHRAMSAVEKALEASWGPRPSPTPPLRMPASPPSAAQPLSTAEAAAALATVSASSKPPSPTSASSSEWNSLASLAAGASETRSSGANPTSAQIATWRASTPRPRWRQTPHGWVRLDAEDPDDPRPTVSAE